MEKHRHRLGGLRRRDEFVLERCAGRRVLHVGAADSPYHERAFAAGRWLHAWIGERTRELVGIDYDGDAVTWLQGRGVRDIREFNAEALESLDELPFDVVLAAEVLEHLSNPGRFLDGAHTVLKPGGVLIITAPNAFWSHGIAFSALRMESVHPDHNYYFSPTTLKTLLGKHGFAVKETIPCMAPASSSLRSRAVGLFARVMTMISPWYADGWIVVASAANEGSAGPS